MTVKLALSHKQVCCWLWSIPVLTSVALATRAIGSQSGEAPRSKKDCIVLAASAYSINNNNDTLRQVFNGLGFQTDSREY